MTDTAPDPLAPDKGRDVRRMFASIAPRYDLLNSVLSAGQDQRWRRRVVAALPTLRPGDRVLDLCSGTGDLALAIERAAPPGTRVHASDFCEDMLARLPGKAARVGCIPRLAVADGGFASRSNERAAQERGVQHVVLPRQPREQRSRLARAALRWRTGSEGRISALKRCHGLRRCRYRGASGMQRWVGLGVLANDLLVLARAGP